MKIESINKEVELKPLKFRDLIAFESMPKDQVPMKILALATGLSDAELSQLTAKEGTSIMAEINKMNGFTDFQKPIN